MRTAYIGMGSNLPSPAGTPEVTLAAAALRLETLGRLAALSSLYSTEPVGFLDQPRFLNAVVALETALGPRPLLDALLAIEKEFGRDRSASPQNGPRTLDLDLLLLGDLVLQEPDLELPHPRLATRAFVLIPLAEIAPQLVVPGHGDTIEELLTRLIGSSPAEPNAVLRLHSPLVGPAPNSGTWESTNP